MVPLESISASAGSVCDGFSVLLTVTESMVSAGLPSTETTIGPTLASWNTRLESRMFGALPFGT